MNYWESKRLQIKSALVLVNPISGQGLGAQIAGPLAKALEDVGVSSEVSILSGPGAAAELVEQKALEHACVVAVGGDGTINEIADALHRFAISRPLGLAPLGLSNCLARHFNIPNRIDKVAAVIAGGRISKLDFIIAGHRSAIAFLGAGFDALVVEKVARDRKGPVNNWKYIYSAFESLSPKNWPALEIEVDGRKLDGVYYQAILSMVTNYAHYFDMPLARKCRLLLFRGQSSFELLHLLPRLAMNRNLARRAEKVLNIENNVKLKCIRGQGSFQVDGEFGGALPLEAKVISQGMSFLTP